MDREEQPSTEATPAAPEISGQPTAKKTRTGPRQFVREIRGEMKRVQWPSRREVTSYSIVVLVAVTLITLYIFGIDQAFGTFVFWIFG